MIKRFQMQHNGVTYQGTRDDTGFAVGSITRGTKKWTLKGHPKINRTKGSYQHGDEVQITIWNSAGTTTEKDRVIYARDWDTVEVFFSPELWRELVYEYFAYIEEIATEEMRREVKNMPMIQNEQSEKKPSDYIKLDKENTVILLSNLYKVESHYIQADKRSVACIGENCKVCAAGKYKKRAEYYYVANVNGEEGILRLPASSFFDMNKIEGMTKKDKRHYSWLIIKEGEGMETRYTTSKDEPIPDSEVADVEKNNARLMKIMKLYETGLFERYQEQPGADVPDEIPVSDPDE